MLEIYSDGLNAVGDDSSIDSWMADRRVSKIMEIYRVRKTKSGHIDAVSFAVHGRHGGCTVVVKRRPCHALIAELSHAHGDRFNDEAGTLVNADSVLSKDPARLLNPEVRSADCVSQKEFGMSCNKSTRITGISENDSVQESRTTAMAMEHDDRTSKLNDANERCRQFVVCYTHTCS